MNNVSIFLVVMALLTMSALPIMKTVSAHSPNGMASGRHADGAYRDGLYLGRLDAQAGRVSRPAVARWSRETDRDMFRAGYEEGFRRTTTKAQ
jgi:hypothetical protein